MQAKDEEKKQSHDDPSDEDEEDMDEMNDQIQELGQVQDGIGSMHIGHKQMATTSNNHEGTDFDSNKPIKANHNFHVPTSKNMGGIPKSNTANKPFADPMAKYQPQQWDEFFDSREMIDGKIPLYHAGNKGHVFFCLHGAGHSALSFAPLAKIVKSDQFGGTLVSFDFRGHGGHYHENEADLSLQNLIDETIYVLKYVISKYAEQSIIVVGHSLGGSIAAKTVHEIHEKHQQEEWAKHIKGLFIIDVSEGNAMEALPFMEDIVKNRPHSFTDVPNVVKYGYLSTQVRDLKSARVTMPGQVVEKEINGVKQYVWRTDLLASKPYWIDWFKGLTEIFLNLRIPKSLMLAGSDRMDKELTIAHMQGKFKLVVVDNVGHVIQEDRPQAVADVFKQFLEQFHIAPQHKEQMVITTISGKKVVINNS